MTASSKQQIYQIPFATLQAFHHQLELYVQIPVLNKKLRCNCTKLPLSLKNIMFLEEQKKHVHHIDTLTAVPGCQIKGSFRLRSSQTFPHISSCSLRSDYGFSFAAQVLGKLKGTLTTLLSQYKLIPDTHSRQKETSPAFAQHLTQILQEPVTAAIM